jgi:hypothetical protein
MYSWAWKVHICNIRSPNSSTDGSRIPETTAPATLLLWPRYRVCHGASDLFIYVAHIYFKANHQNAIFAVYDRAWTGGLTTAGVDLIAMVVSDSGLASAEPQWWNASALGCFLIGLQPRGGWQIMQRTVQWGQDDLSSIFGVTCSMPILYAYFSCSIRNRLEVWDSPAWPSPMQGLEEGNVWQAAGMNVNRPTKLIDGSRGGQGFICGILRPKDNDHYSIVEQARMQMLSVMLVAAASMHPESRDNMKTVMQEYFEVGDRLGLVFGRLLVGLAVANFLSIGFTIAIIYSLFWHNLFGPCIPYIIKLCALLSWAVGAISLLMLGGNPRVKIINRAIPAHVESRLPPIISKPDEKSPHSDIRLDFGSIHGSVYTPDQGHCTLPAHVVYTICSWDLELQRPRSWKLGFAWSSVLLLLSIALQIAGAKVQTIWSEVMAVIFLLATSLARGYGISGPEKWLIPKWKIRQDTNYGASLLGRMVARS